MQPSPRPLNIAIVGAGLAGSLCAQRLQQAGHRVQVWDKARGPGGRLATRRASWTGADGTPWQAALDHGAPAFQARTAEGQAWVQALLAQGQLAPWSAAAEADTGPWAAGASTPATGWVVPTPDLPALCRQALAQTPLHTGLAVQTLQRSATGWRLLAQDRVLAEGLDQVWLALPPAQAAPLLAAHRPGWAAAAQAAPMLPVWTVMAATQDSTPPPVHPAWRPRQGPLAWVMRQDRRPGRSAATGLQLWVAHARPDWSASHLELSAEQALAQLLPALALALGDAPTWLYSTAHRWRYALPAQCVSTLQIGAAQPAVANPVARAWWAPDLGLGVCGDFLSPPGLHALEGAWLSARALCRLAMQNEAAEPD